jgi:hypothetical protein
VEGVVAEIGIVVVAILLFLDRRVRRQKIDDDFGIPLCNIEN